MAQQMKEKKSFSHTDCEKELIRKGEDSARAAEICKGRGQSQGERSGDKSWQEEEKVPNE